MQKILYVLILSALIFISCANEAQEKNSAKLTVAEVTMNASEYVGKSVTVTGTAVHVCRHGGKRLFMIGENPEERFKVTAGTDVGSFDVKLEGSDLLVQGIVEEQRVDEAFLNSWEEEMNAETKPEVGHEGHEHAEDKEEHDSSQTTKINEMRQKLADSGKEYLSFYSLKCESVKEL